MGRNSSRIVMFAAAIIGLATGGVALDSAHARTFKVLQSFCTQADCDDGDGPGGLVKDGAGNIYGTTSVGGIYGRGTIFKLRFNRNSGRYTREILHHFCSESLEINCEDGAYPLGGLIRDKAGNLYGTTYRGGAEACATGGLQGCGVVFGLMFDAETRTYTLRRLLSFNATGNGDRNISGSAYPSGLVMDADGNLYGGSVGAGANDDYGSVFKLTPNASKTRWSHKTLYTFCRQSFCRDGQGVYSGVTMDRLGNLYGTTFEGGANDRGSVFALLLNRSTGNYAFKIIHSFCATCGFSNGVNPGRVMVDRAGTLFGTTEWDTGEGTVFRLTPNAGKTAWAYKVLRQFCAQANCTDGDTPSTNLVMDADGNIFGGTRAGGRDGQGTLFKLTPNGAGTAYGYSVLYHFCRRTDCADGAKPNSLIIDDDGNLIASTSFGGTGDDGGAVVELVND